VSNKGRREFISLLGGAAAWPLAAAAQQTDRVRHVGLLTNLAKNDLEARARMEAFQQELQQLGWTVGQNLQIDTRSTLGDAVHNGAVLSPDPVTMRLPSRLNATLQTSSSGGWAKTLR
jgi:hypothetical protein